MRMMKNLTLLLTILVIITFSGNARESDPNPFYFSLKPQYGFIIPHSSSIKNISDFQPYGFGAEGGWHLLKDKDWERCNCYSRTGFTILHINYNSPDILGSSTNLIAFAEPFFNYQGFVLTSVRMGVGASYLSKTYDAKTNPENMFFSSHLSFLVHLDLNVTKYLTDQWFLHGYFKYNHISNGGISKPNKGMNFPTYGLGVGYSFDRVRFEEKKKKELKKPTPVIPSVQAFGTLLSTEQDDEIYERSLAMGVLVKGRKKVSRINALNAGVEGSVDFSVKEKMKEATNHRDHKQLSALIGHDFVFGKFIFSQYWGTYIYAPYYEKRNFFQRYGLTYELFDNFRMGVTLKAHAQVAENFNLMIEYDLR
ncbi:MAG: acyloxyacyl hydrolase [Bacteroidota bacterium]